MKKRKGSLLQRTMAVLLSAVLVAGMLSNAVPVTVLAQETAGQQEDTGGSRTETAAGDTKPEEKTETTPAEGTGSGEQEKPAPEGQENPGTTEDGDGLTGQEPGGGMEEKPQEPGGTEEGQPKPGDGAGEEQPESGGGMEEKPQEPGGGTEEETEPGTVSGNDAAQEPVAAPQTVMMAEPVAQADNIASGEGWTLAADGKLTISSDAGMTNWINNGRSHCEKVTSVEIQNGVTGIGNAAFMDCSGLTDITIPKGVTSIGNDVFSGCSGLTDIEIPEGVTSIGDYAFFGCSGLTDITIPKGVTSIGNNVFYGCSGLTDIEIPEGVTSIGDYAFSGCSGLTDITIPEGVTSIGNSAFSGCSGLTDITIPKGVTSIGNFAFSSCRGLTDIEIPEGVTSIGKYAFSGCSGLTDITIPKGVTSIGNDAFSSCSGLTDIEIPEGVTSIGNSAFSGCSGLTGITISKSVMSIGNYAFYNCSGLTKVTMKSEAPPTLGTGIFTFCGFVQKQEQGIHVPEGKAQVYKEAWSDWKAYITDETHTHSWSSEWTQSETHHWHECAVQDCPVTDDAKKDGYGEHTYDDDSDQECNVCGYSKTSTEEHKHNDVTFTAWTKTDSLPDTAGNYYLTENVTLSATWDVPGEETTLCLNGKTISAEGNANDSRWLIVIDYTEDIENGRTWNLYDCAGGGQITGGSRDCVGNGATFYMYGGKITGGIGVGVDNNGAFYMYGGEISGNGGRGTYCDQYGSTITVGGSAVITGNNRDNVWILGDSLIEIDEENPLSAPAKIGITTKTAPTAGNPVNITGENGKDYSKFFHSDNPDYVIVNGENNVVQLAVKPHTHNLTRVDAKNATCTEDGNTAYYTCDGCDQWFSDESGTQEITDKTSVVIPAAGHDFDDIEWGYKAADGHAHSCKNCDAHDEIQEHTPGDAATESTPQICTACGYIIKPAIGHTCNPRLVEKKEPDCTTAGKEAYYHCEGCGKNYEDEAGTRLIADISAWGSIAALGHDWGEWTVTKPATATTPGEKERICKRCNEKETEIIPKKGGGSGGNSGGGTSGGSDDNSGGNSGDNGGNNGGNQDSSGNGSGSSGGNGNAGGSTGNTGGTGAGTSGKPGAPGAGQPKVKQEKEGNIRKEVRVEGESTLDAAVETPLSELADMVLTKEEKQKAAGGTGVRIVLDVKDASAVVSAADKALVEKALNGSLAKGYTLGQYLDINLFKVIGDSRSAITETNRKITVTIDVPDSLKNTDGTKTRTFAVIRVHDGKAELLADLDDNAETITIKTDRFSTYAVVYKDTAGGNGKPGVVRVSAKSDGKNPGGGKDGEPKTGDSTPLELSATLAMIAGFAYLLLYFADRERGMTEETKKELVSRMIGWAKQGGRIRKYLALAAIFALLVYYHSIGKKAETEWKAIYGE